MALSVLLLVPAVRARAQVAEDEVYPVPASGTYTLDGHGYGHGIGLSQWGAFYGADTQGATAAQILAHYYPGTNLASDGSPRPIRVRIDEAAPNQLVVPAQSGLTATDTATGQTIPFCSAPAQITAWGVNIISSAQELWSYYSGAFHRCASVTGPIVFSTGGDVIETLPGGVNRTFAGTVEAVTTGSASLAVVNTVDLEDYVEGVVPNESPSSWPAAALQAQAIAARSYALYHYNSSLPWDICDNTYCQVYGGVSSEQSTTNAATVATTGQVLDYNGAPILAMYSASNGGYSVSGGMPYLPAQPDPWDVDSPEHSWTVQVAAARIAALYPQVATLQDVTVTSRDGNGQWQGRVLQVRLDGTGGSVTVAGATLSGQLGLDSNWWTVDPSTYSSSSPSPSPSTSPSPSPSPSPPPGPLAPGYSLGAAWQGSDTLSVVGRNPAGGVSALSWQAGHGWGAPVNLGGVIVGHPQAAPGPNGSPLALAEGTNGAAYVRPVFGGHWSLVGGSLTAAPAGVEWAPGHFSLFARGTDASLWVRTWINGWGHWWDVGGVLAPGVAPTAVSPAPGRISVFVDGPHGVLWERDWGPGGWDSWTNLGEAVNADPAAASGGANLIVAIAPLSGALRASAGAPGALRAWSSLGSGFAAGPAAAAWPARAGRRVDAFDWLNGQVVQSTWSGSSWTPWRSPF
ncbi:MAG: SpoIID/LytB domain-containing protein [Mycobacteriales bacterium]